MEKINIAELLKNCPSGMELDCTMYEDTFFYEITADQIFPIRIKRIDGGIIALTKYGEYANCPSSKCVIFPKGKTTWEGFQRQFKDGDIIFTRGGNYNWVSIFKQFSGGNCYTYVDLCMTNNDLFTGTSSCLCTIEKIDTQRLATEEEKGKLFQAIKANGYKWNVETKSLEKLIESKFKVGDKIKSKDSEQIINIITKIYENSYELNNGRILLFNCQDNWELVSNKFDINALVPFESKVLVRDGDNDIWHPAIWGCIGVPDIDIYPYIVMGGVGFDQCIPYEGNEHLLSTTNDCDKYYKTWE